MFLYSDREYTLPLFDSFQPEKSSPPKHGCLISFLTSGRRAKEAWKAFDDQVDLDNLWPYASREELEADRRCPKLLAGKT
ncbi:MAG: hypothetical protein O7G85_03390 [Planctomycetota bacterium]|nr:hypothetical protein [Planctomycetota bacterium]